MSWEQKWNEFPGTVWCSSFPRWGEIDSLVYLGVWLDQLSLRYPGKTWPSPGWVSKSMWLEFELDSVWTADLILLLKTLLLSQQLNTEVQSFPSRSLDSLSRASISTVCFTRSVFIVDQSFLLNFSFWIPASKRDVGAVRKAFIDWCRNEVQENLWGKVKVHVNLLLQDILFPSCEAVLELNVHSAS